MLVGKDPASGGKTEVITVDQQNRTAVGRSVLWLREHREQPPRAHACMNQGTKNLL